MDTRLILEVHADEMDRTIVVRNSSSSSCPKASDGIFHI